MLKFTVVFFSSKKDTALRYKELLTMVSPPFLQYIVDHARDLVLENASLLLVLSILNYSLGMLLTQIKIENEKGVNMTNYFY